MMDRQTLLRRLDGARAPRYTSYPPANRFTDAVGPDDAARWLAEVPAGAEVSVYLHVPFCRRLCWFCACRTQGTATDAPLEPYVDALQREIETVSGHLLGVRASRIHLGGGTPTILPPHLLARVMDAAHGAFPPVPDAEISVEIDPTVLDDSRLDALAGAGLTRASLGVQDFDTRVQTAIGRPQSIAQTRAAVDGLRARGVANLNLDLLYGLPHQAPDTLARTLSEATALWPDRVALDGYAHVPWMARRQVMIPADALPDPAARLDLFDQAATHFEAAGLHAVGIDHFARSKDGLAQAARLGRLRRNFQGYTDDGADVLIGLGASAISRLPSGYVQNEPRTGLWSGMVRGGRLPTSKGYAMTPDNRVRAAIIERLLCDFVARPAEVARRTGRSSSDVVLMLLQGHETWPEATATERDGSLVVLERKLARLVAQSFDTVADAGRHSLVA